MPGTKQTEAVASSALPCDQGIYQVLVYKDVPGMLFRENVAQEVGKINTLYVL